MEILSLVAGLASAALLLVDLLPDAHLGWSRYAVASVLFGWIVVAAPFLLFRRIKTTLTVIGAAIIAFILVLDGLDGSLDWSFALGLPITLLSYLAITATGAIISRRPNKGINILGIGAIGLSAYLVALETVIQLGLGLRPAPVLVPHRRDSPRAGLHLPFLSAQPRPARRQPAQDLQALGKPPSRRPRGPRDRRPPTRMGLKGRPSGQTRPRRAAASESRWRLGAYFNSARSLAASFCPMDAAFWRSARASAVFPCSL